MAQKLKEIVDLDKIQHVWDVYLEHRIVDEQDALINGLNKVEKLILEALAEDFKDQINYN